MELGFRRRDERTGSVGRDGADLDRERDFTNLACGGEAHGAVGLAQRFGQLYKFKSRRAASATKDREETHLLSRFTHTCANRVGSANTRACGPSLAIELPISSCRSISLAFASVLKRRVMFRSECARSNSMGDILYLES